MFRITGLRSWNLNADNLDDAVAFYSALGATESGRQTLAGAAVVRLKAGAHGIGLFDAASGPRPGIPHHTFNCEGPADPDELSRELAAIGITVDSVRREREGSGYSVYVDDPSGNRIELAVTPSA